MAALQQSIRDNALYAYGYLQGRSLSLPRSFSDLYGLSISKITSFISLPLPLLSFLALPFFGGTSTSINLVFFYLTWSALVFSHDQLAIEIYGTLAVRVMCFLIPAFGFLAFDLALPSASKAIKAKGAEHLPSRLSRNKLLEVSGVAIVNVMLGVALQAAVELLTTEVLHMRSVLKVSTAVPLPWSVAKDVLRGFVFRGVLHYVVHRYLLHGFRTPLRMWHLRWQHSIVLPLSLAAAYDHPICYLLAQWLPLYATAATFRMRVLTWHILLALISLEELFVYSGYAVLPSSIVLAGMARRTDAHFVATQKNSGKTGNFGHWGLLDFVCGTSVGGEADVVDDLQDEAEKHRIQERAQDTMKGALDGIRGEHESAKLPQASEDAEDGDYVPNNEDPESEKEDSDKQRAANSHEADLVDDADEQLAVDLPEADPVSEADQPTVVPKPRNQGRRVRRV